MKRLISTLTLAIALAAGLAVGVSTTSTAEQRRGWVPPPKTVVSVQGDRVHGFTIHHYDGSTLHPPTGSEAWAECGEYDRWTRIVRCRTEARVWYRELGKMKRSLRYAFSVHMAT